MMYSPLLASLCDATSATEKVFDILNTLRDLPRDLLSPLMYMPLLAIDGLMKQK